MPEPVRVAFLGCGFITRVHSGHLRALGGEIVAELRQPRQGQGRGVLPRVRRRRELRRLSRGDRRSGGRRRGRRRAAAVPSRPDAAGARRRASTCWSRSRRSSAWRTTAPCSRRGMRRGAVVLVGENDHYKPLAVRLRRAARRRRHRRDGVRPFRDDRPAAEARGRLAQRRSDGRRRRVLRGRDPLAAHRRQPRPADRRRSTATGRRCRAKGRTGARRA